MAGVDLGSNSFHLMVARAEDDGRIHVLDRLRDPVRLAAGLDTQGVLSREAAERGLAALERFGASGAVLLLSSCCFGVILLHSCCCFGVVLLPLCCCYAAVLPLVTVPPGGPKRSQNEHQNDTKIDPKICQN